jgi:GTPase SAR1 family protein
MSITITFVGAENVGKSALIRRWNTGEWNPLRMEEPENMCSSFFTSIGRVSVRCTEHNHVDSLSGKEDAAVVVFDNQQRESFLQSMGTIQTLSVMYPGKPIIWVGTHVDCRHRKVTPKMIGSRLNPMRKYYPDILYYDISAKSMYALDKPFLAILRKVSGYPELIFTEF